MLPTSLNSDSEESKIRWPDHARVDEGSLAISIENESRLELPVSEKEIQRIIASIATEEKISGGHIELVYVTPDEMIRMNTEFLGKEYLTDNIAFQYEDEGDPIEATIYQCPVRIEEQAEEFGTTFVSEFVRVLIHGVLHLCGYRDHIEAEKQLMRQKEEEFLRKLNYS